MLKLPCKNKKKMLFITCIIALLWNNNAILNDCIKTTEKMRTKKMPDIADRLSEDKDNLYLIDASTMDSIQTLLSPYKSSKKRYYSNLYTLGGWATRLPLKKEIIDGYGIGNPLKDAVNKNNVYFVDHNSFVCKYNYMREHYYPDLVYVLVKDLGISQIYKIYHASDLTVPNHLESLDSNRVYFKNFKLVYNDAVLHLYGELSVDGFDTFDQEIFIKAKNLENGSEKVYQAMTYIDNDKKKDKINVMSKDVLKNFTLNIPSDEIGNQMQFQIILKYHNHFYNIKTINSNS